MPFRAFLRAALLVAVLTATATGAAAASDAWRTIDHSPGTCATYGICGHRPDGASDFLSCAANVAPRPVADPAKLAAVCPQLAAECGSDAPVCCTDQQLDILQAQIQQAVVFLVGCPACTHNFKHFFCLMTCSPDQATFTNVTAVQSAADPGKGADPHAAVAEMDVFLSSDLGTALYDSCSDVIFAPVNQRALNFVGGGAHSYQEWVDFLGLVKDKRSPPQGSPFQINFPPVDALPEGMEAMAGKMAGCGDPGPLACSCGDCPGAPACEPPPPPPPPPQPGCPALHTPGPLTCLDLTFLAAFLAVAVCIPAFVRFAARQQVEEAAWFGEGPSPAGLGAPLLTTDDAEISGDADAGPSSNPITGGTVEEGEVIEYPASEELLRTAFHALGMVCSRRPWRTLAVCGLAVILATAGVFRLQVVTEPAKLWVGPGSQAAAERDSYEAAFGPFYRISQMILSISPDESGKSLPIVSDENIRLLFAMQAEVDALTVPGFTAAPGDQDPSESGATLDSVCLKPLGDACATQSVLQYWQGDLDSYEGITGPALSPTFCFEHWTVACRAATGAPVDPRVVLGGFPRTGNVSFAEDATAFIVTYPLVSEPSRRRAAEAWEAAFLDLAAGKLTEMAEGAGLRLSYSTERSVEDELRRESGTDAGTVALSYGVMLLYVALALGKIPRGATWRTALVHGKSLLALGGVVAVAAAVAAALGLCGWTGIGATLIIMEVIPFLALAIGVDNVFIMTAAAERCGRPGMTPAERAAAALAASGPSMLLAATSETLGFAAGTLTSMPALRDFAACAAFAIAIDFLLQITAFPAMLALDAARVESRRYDITPWIKAPSPWMEEEDATAGDGNSYGSGGGGGRDNPEGYDAFDAEEYGEQGGGRLIEPPALGYSGSSPAGKHPWQLVAPGEEEWGEGAGGWGVGPALRWYMRRVHAPLLSRPWVKGIVLLVFSGAFLGSAALLPRLEKGLDQRVALPRDSYLQRYFGDVADLLRVGPPVSFVVRGLNVSADALDISAVCSVAGCDSDSLLNRVAAGAREPWASWLAKPASSWLDDFLSWASPEAPQCCRVFPNGTACPPPDQPPCWDPTIMDPDQSTHLCDACTACFAPEDLPPGSRPSASDFATRLPQFLQALPSAQCAKGGVGAYTDALERDDADPTGVKGLSDGIVAASAFMSYYVPLSAQSDFVAAMRATRDLAASASKALGLDIFSYSIFHIFFEQYLTLGGEALTMMGSAAVAVFTLCLLATGSPAAAALLLGVLCMLCVDLAGVMVLAGVQANAVSLVNLSAAVGIGVEFCVHVVHSFLEAEGSRERRCRTALGEVGAAVLSGITLTKLVGVAVLASARTEIFRLYYFKFYLSLVVLGAAHGLVFLPVILSTLGPEGFHHWRVRRAAAAAAAAAAQ